MKLCPDDSKAVIAGVEFVAEVAMLIKEGCFKPG